MFLFTARMTECLFFKNSNTSYNYFIVLAVNSFTNLSIEPMMSLMLSLFHSPIISVSMSLTSHGNANYFNLLN
jgi:hypothetical protein